MIATNPLPPFLFFFVFSSSFLSQYSSSQFAPQNIQVFYPFHPPPPPNPPPTPLPPSPPPLPPPSTDTTTPPLTPNPVTTSPPSNSSNENVLKAVGATAATTLVLSGLVFFLLVKYKRRRKENVNLAARSGNEAGNAHDPVLVLNNNRFTRVEGIKGVIVDEEGLDVLYWKNLDDDDRNGNNKNAIFKKQHSRIFKNEGRKSQKIDVRIQEIPLLGGESSGSHVWPDDSLPVKSLHIKRQPSSRSPPPTPPPQPSVPPPPPPLPQVVVKKKSSVPPPPPTAPAPVERKSFLLSPPLPPPPLPPKTSSLTSSLSSSSSSPPSKVPLKPLHWDKVNANVGHSMAWDKMENGSFRFDGDLMEAMFGTAVVHKKPPLDHNKPPTPQTKLKSGPPSKIFILETPKSQNIAIILRSLVVSRQEIIDCLQEGKGLDIETLEKLTKIHPTNEEQQLILKFDQDITRLADAESFLYHILRAVPTAFVRFNAMFFRLSYMSEVSEVKNSIQILEMACKELRTRGLFVKLLEAVLKAGNRMNVGTSRGNAQAFDMNSLLKLSDVKSSDGKTTLLHFVVEEVVRLEGKRCMISRNNSFKNSTVDTSRDRDNIKLGLPAVGGVSSEFSNVKKAAEFDYDVVLRSCSGLSDRLGEVTKAVDGCGGDGDGRGFVREMKKFVERAEREIQVVREDQERVIGLVNKTNEYYRAGASKDKGKKQFQLFVIVRDFLKMVDKACVDIAVKLQKSRNVGGDELVKVGPNRPTMKFPVLPPDFISRSSSDSEDDDDL